MNVGATRRLAQICKSAMRPVVSIGHRSTCRTPMNDALFLPTSAPPQTPHWRLAAKQLWQGLTRDEREAYLSKATDCADLERRQRAWDRCGAVPWPLGPWSW
jgi:hypothetical protein